MTSRVYRLHSTLELPLEDAYDFFEDPELPPEIADIDITRRNNTLIVSAVAEDETMSKYTPTAQLKASVTENRVYEEDPDEMGPPGAASTGSGGGPQWGALEEEEEEIESELVEYACFKGDRETVLQNTALQYEMFEVLCAIAKIAEKGALTAIAAVDGEPTAVRIVDGEELPASINVVEDPSDEDENEGVNWRDNEFIS
ncbi:hypothetical protein ACFQH8_07890 [Halomicroarcula sp. GCM10025710]